MKTISVLVPETAVLSTIDGPQQMFNAVNGFLVEAGREPLFKVQLVAPAREVKLNGGLVTVRPDLLLGQATHSDLVIVPAICGNVQEATQLNQTLFPWIVQQYQDGAEVASLCIGAFLLASTGLLNGKSCSTHWLFAHEFRNMFPEVTLMDDRIITAQNGLYSSGGATSFWNLLLYLVEKYTDREMAVMASKFYLLDIDRTNQLQFAVFNGQKNHGDELVLAAQQFVEQYYQDKLTVDQLAGKFGVGRRTFERRFKRATTNTVVEYMQRVKIEAAKKQLEIGRKTVRDVFKRIAGMSPADYREKYKYSFNGKAR